MALDRHVRHQLTGDGTLTEPECMQGRVCTLRFFLLAWRASALVLDIAGTP